MKTLIKNVIIDNEQKNILIDDGKIVAIANEDFSADNIFNAEGLYAIPGGCNCFFDGCVEDCINLVKQGITTVFDFSFDEEVTRKLISLGLNVYVAIGDHNGNNILDQESLIFETNKVTSLGAIEPIIYLANPNVCDESQYDEVIKFASAHNYLMATHTSEYLEDVGEIDNLYGKSPVELLESYGFLDHKHMLIDCIFADQDDVNLLSNYETNICILPTTNLKNGSGIAPLYSFLKNKLNVVLGGNVRNIYNELSLARDLQSGYLNEKNIISIEQISPLITKNIKDIFTNIGNLKAGDYADIVLTDNTNLEKITPLNILHSFAKGVKIL